MTEREWEHDVRIAHLTAKLSLFDVHFDGKDFPKSADVLLNKQKPVEPMTKEQWQALVSAMEANFGPPMSEEEAKKARPRKKKKKR